jgi:multicomponent Na+:H+ antiporter subunit E
VIYLTLNLLLAIVWMLLRADFSIGGLLGGFLVGFIAIGFGRVASGSSAYVRATCGLVMLSLGFLRELVISNLQLARDLLRPHPPFRPGFVRFPVADLRPPETVLLANLISLTPGTVTVDIREDGTELVVHSLYAGDPERMRRALRRLADLVRTAVGAPAPNVPRSPT